MECMFALEPRAVDGRGGPLYGVIGVSRGDATDGGCNRAMERLFRLDTSRAHLALGGADVCAG